MSDDHPRHCATAGARAPTLTRAGVRAGAPLAAVPNGVEDRPEECLGGQDARRLGSRLLEGVRKLWGKVSEEGITLKAR